MYDTSVHLNAVLHKFITSVCVSICVTPRIVARQRLDTHVPVAMNTRSNRGIAGGVVFYAVRVVSKVNRRLVLPITYFPFLYRYEITIALSIHATCNANTSRKKHMYFSYCCLVVNLVSTSTASC
jgi:hypothetical protein